MTMQIQLMLILPILFAAASAGPAWSADATAAQALLKKSDCLKCHALDKKKKGPSFQETAKKHKGEADAEAKLVKHMTSSPMVEIEGQKEEHPKIKTTSQDEIKNVAQWILAQ